MKKIIAVGAAAVMLAFSGSAATAAPYPVTQPTNTEASGPSQVEKGERARFRVESNAQGNDGACTGQYVFTVKKGAKVVKTAAKPGDRSSVRFTFTPRSRGEFRIITKYRRGIDDPCGKSRDFRDLQAG